METALKEKLINITCPFPIERHGKLGICGRLVVRVSPNSYGEGWCRSCRRDFYYEVNGEAPKSKIKPKKVE